MSFAVSTLDSSQLPLLDEIAAISGVSYDNGYKDVSGKTAGTEQNDFFTTSGKRDKIDCGAGDDAVLVNGSGKKSVTLGEGKDVLAVDMAKVGKKGKTVVNDFASGTDKLVIDGKAKIEGIGTNKLVISSGGKKYVIESKGDAFSKDDIEII